MKADIVFFNRDLENDFARSLYEVEMVLKNGVAVYTNPGKQKSK
ncbi:hypothetical protein [Emticicia sp. 21SJ11W-3]|nr:hypothetical protein [Emticicia sp. 21SJ11W-3]